MAETAFTLHYATHRNVDDYSGAYENANYTTEQAAEEVELYMSKPMQFRLMILRRPIVSLSVWKMTPKCSQLSDKMPEVMTTLWLCLEMFMVAA